MHGLSAQADLEGLVLSLAGTSATQRRRQQQPSGRR